MTNGTDTGPDPIDADPTRPDVGWNDAPADQQHPESAFPGAGERVDDAERRAALDASLPIEDGEG